MDRNFQRMREGFNTAFIDGSTSSDAGFRPQFISNDYRRGKKVVAAIEKELKRCDEFFISAAFITRGGITPLLQTLKELESRGVKGKVLTTDYLAFSEPGALRKLNTLRNVEVKMCFTAGRAAGFHTKGYVFRQGQIYRMIVGSANMTMKALSVNREWNAKMVSAEDGEFLREMRSEFTELWDSAVPFDQCAEDYERYYREAREKAEHKVLAQPGSPEQVIQPRRSMQPAPSLAIEAGRSWIDEDFRKPAEHQDPAGSLIPNPMQRAFTENLMDLVSRGESRALLISATGTGKTYASAFALRQMDPGKILFLVHREQIARQARDAYQKVFGKGRSSGILSGSSREKTVDMVFATVQTMGRDDVLTGFARDEFDVIVIDEVHRAGAGTHRKIMEYFRPRLYLGMTASPERTDGFDIFGMFHHNIAYEIRLRQALEEDLLCPFHYFGITELEIGGEVFDDETGIRNFSRLVADERVDRIIEKAGYYGWSGDRVKGLVFCSSRQEAVILSEKFNRRGFRTLDLSGEDSQAVRAEAVERLVSDDRGDRLDYLFTVDIFNEGVDIPEINQIIMLRPTQSPIVFVQQLGRGLRKSEGKEFLVVLDFIGNYRNNFMIPVALSGDRSYNKDAIRRYVSSGTRLIPGCSSIHFDEIARERVYESIDRAKTGDARLLREAYELLKYRVGHVPSLMEFDIYGTVDAVRIFDSPAFGSYYTFLRKCDGENYDVELSGDEVAALECISRRFARGKRPHELEMLGCLADGFADPMDEFGVRMRKRLGREVSEAELISTVNNLTFDFFMKKEREKLGKPFMKKKARALADDPADVSRETGERGFAASVSDDFAKMLENQDFREMVKELVMFGLSRFEENFARSYRQTNFTLYGKYTYEDICRLLNWEKQRNPINVGGYFYEKETKTMPVFINYRQDQRNAIYEHRFLSNRELIAFSKHPRQVTSSDADHIYKRTDDDRDNKIYLFVRRNKDDREAKEFYFMGEIRAVGEPKPVILEKSGDEAFEITYLLEDPVRDELFEYITGDDGSLGGS